MKELILSKDQEANILEILGYLFPTYTIKLLATWRGYISMEAEGEPSVNIHWFELCNRFIAPKLLLVELKMEHLNEFHKFQNPIIYLWREFQIIKKLKEHESTKSSKCRKQCDITQGIQVSRWPATSPNPECPWYIGE